MKKILSIFITAFIVFSMFSFVFAAESAAPGKAISSMGLADKFIPDSDEEITKGEFAYLAAKLVMEDTEMYSSSEQVFVDVPKSSPYFSSVMCLRQAGIVTGASALYFYPDSKITVEEACIIMVRLLGYEHHVEGGNTYLHEASRLKLLRGMDTARQLTYNGAYTMMLNALEADISMDNTVDGRHLPAGSVMMTVRHGIYKCEGRVNDNGITSLYGNTEVREGYLEIGGVLYLNRTDRSDLLGKSIKGYYKYENDEKVLLYACESGNSTTINADDIKGFDGGVYEVFTGGKKTLKYNLPRGFKLIYNEVAVTSDNSLTEEALKELMMPECGSVTLISQKNKNEYDVVIVQSFETMVVKDVDADEKILYSYTSEPQQLLLNEFDELKIIGAGGFEAEIDTITEYNVLSVMRSYDNKRATIYISTETAKGTLSYIVKDDREITVDGKKYEYLPKLADSIGLDGCIGKTVIVYLRVDGTVAYLKVLASDGDIYAFVYAIGAPEIMSDEFRIKLYTEYNEIQEFKITTSTRIDGQKYKNINKAYDYFSKNPYAVKNVVMLKYDDNNKVIRIDTAYNPSGMEYNAPLSTEDINTLHIVNGIYETTYTMHNSRIGDGIIMVDDTTRVFVVPQSGRIEDIYETGVTAASVSKEAPQYTITAYTLDDNSLLANAIVLRKASSGYDITNSVVASRVVATSIVTQIMDAITPTGETAKLLVITTGGVEDLVYTATPDGAKCMKSGKEVRVGDIIKYGTDKYGYIPDGQLAIMYSPADDKDNLIYNTGSFNGSDNALTYFSYGILNGTVKTINDRYVKLLLSDGTEKIYPLAEFKYVVYDSKARQRVRFGNQTDILSFDGTGKTGTRVLLDWYQGKIRFAYIIK